jgi:hypothetical protein
MLPEFLDSVYKRYKQDTSIFLHWLAENGKNSGYTLTSTTASGRDGELSAKKQRLKGKARKEAKAAGISTSSSAKSASDTAPQNAHLIPSHELLALVNAIVGSANPIKVPTGIIQVRSTTDTQSITTFLGM